MKTILCALGCLFALSASADDCLKESVKAVVSLTAQNDGVGSAADVSVSRTDFVGMRTQTTPNRGSITLIEYEIAVATSVDGSVYRVSAFGNNCRIVNLSLVSGF